MNQLSADHNVTSLMAEIARTFPKKPALVFVRDGKNELISFGELWRDAQSTAAGLTNLGLCRGDRVIVMIPMSIDLYVCLLAVIQMGAVAVFVDPWIGAKQIASFSAFAEPSAFVGINKSHFLRWSNSRLRSLKISVTNEFRIGPFPAQHSLSKLKLSIPKSSEPFASIAKVAPDHPALITFTSGSSGVPKGANRTHRFLRAQHLALKHEFPYLPNDVDMPMFPVFALNNLVTGITSVVPAMDFRKVAEVDGDCILKQIRDWNITTCTASPPLLDRLATAVERIGPIAGKPKIPLRRVLTGGAPVSNEQLQLWTSAFETETGPTEVIVAYGSTEAEPVSHIDGLERIKIHDQAADSKQFGFCTGKPNKLVQAKIIRISKNPIDLSVQSLAEIELPTGEIGELIVSGEHVCCDYYKNQDASAANKLAVGNTDSPTIWHRMGDTGYFDEAGRFWLVGRVHTTIFRKNDMIHTQLVEQIAKRASSKIEQVAAIGCRDPILDEAIVIVVVTQSEYQNDIEGQIRVAIKEANQPCDQIVFTRTPLPVDPRHNSKIDYEKVREQFGS